MRAAVIETVQFPVPEHPLPDHPAKLEPVPADAVRVTLVPEVKLALFVEQVVPQEIPAGVETTVPTPAPDLLSVRV